jgi:hypothetical protein
MSLLSVSQRIYRIKFECVLLPKHHTMKIYGVVEKAKFHTLIYTPPLDRGEWSVSCVGQGRVFWYLSARRLIKPCYQFRSNG